MTLGTLRMRLLKQYPGTDADILDGYIADRYGEILQSLAWSRLEKSLVLQTVAPYQTGTVTVTAGSPAVTLAGAAWTAGMTGRQFRVTGDNAFYGFTYATATTGTLDRPYQGTGGSLAAYSIYQSIYAMPPDCRILEDNAFTTPDLGPLQRLSRDQLNLSAPSRPTFGTPMNWASFMDDTNTPPDMQVELYPCPDASIGIPFHYTAELLQPGTGSAAFAAWMEPATALVEGVSSKILRLQKDYNGAQLAAAEAQKALSTMRANEALRQPVTRMRLPDYLIRHRLNRWQRP